MSEPIKKQERKPEGYQPGVKPVIIDLAEEKQNNKFSEVFVRKNTVELVTLNEEIKVVGLDYNKCKETGSVTLNYPFDLYTGDKIKLQENIRNLKRPQTGYAVWSGREKFVNGKEVTDFNNQDELYGSITIPAGRYVKVSWNAGDFSELVTEAMAKAWERSGSDEFLEEHGLICDEKIYVEAYPHETMCIGRENGPEWYPNVKNAYEIPITQYPEIYILRSIKEKE